jgi:hypothetical protein
LEWKEKRHDAFSWMKIAHRHIYTEKDFSAGFSRTFQYQSAIQPVARILLKLSPIILTYGQDCGKRD